MTDTPPLPCPITPGGKIDCAAWWDSLDPALQRQAGIAALVFAVTDSAGFEDNGQDAAAGEAMRALGAVVEPFLDQLDEVLLPDLDALGVQACRVCGCTDAQGCISAHGDTCHWVGEDLCSACAPANAHEHEHGEAAR